MSTKISNFKSKKDSTSQNKSRRDTNMENVRIVQKNLVFVSGLPSSLSDSELLKTNDYFGKYGKVYKIVTNAQQPLRKPYSYQAYVTYNNSIDAAIAITALDGFNFEDKSLKVSFGTTKYCAHFLRGYDCLNPDCFYLHEFDRKNQVLNRDTKSIFDEQNQEAIDIVYDNMDQIVERIVQNVKKDAEEGFPSLMEMMEFLVQSKAISGAQLNKLLKKHNQLRIPKLTLTVSSPPSVHISLKGQTDSPKQASKLTKSNSFSTMASPYKSQCQTQKKIGTVQQKELSRQRIIGQKEKQKEKQRTDMNMNDKKQYQNYKSQQKVIKSTKIQKAEKFEKCTVIEQVKNREQQQLESNIEKQFLKHILKINQKSKSRMNFASEVQASQIYKIKEIIQKHLIISN